MSQTVVHARPDRAEPVDDGLWTVDAEPIHPLGFPLPLRMTVVRLANGDLVLYSPTHHSPALQRELEALGRIRHLVASNIAHWMFVRDWQLACPDAVTWGVPGLSRRAQVREQGLRVDAELGPVAPAAWADELDQVMVTSGPFVEVDLFHRASGTLLVTDLVLNVDGADLPHLLHTAAEISGILAPNGKAPLHLRLLLKLNGRAVGRAGERLIAFAPKRVIMCHGHPHEVQATDRLREALDWFVGWDGPKRALGPVGAGAIGAGLLLGVGLAAAGRRRRRKGR
ncbi:MAG: DUF4336 domain-containing protein [Janthinobacterium lividum]